jgi:hypothetical protein
MLVSAAGPPSTTCGKSSMRFSTSTAPASPGATCPTTYRPGRPPTGTSRPGPQTDLHRPQLPPEPVGTHQTRPKSRAFGIHHGQAKRETSGNVPIATQGIDAGKRTVGRKRGIITDTLGLLLAVIVTAASVSDNIVGMTQLDRAIDAYPTLAKESSNTAADSASTSSPKTRRSKASQSSNAAGPSNAPSAGSCNTAPPGPRLRNPPGNVRHHT